jgi:hypothetical protein
MNLFIQAYQRYLKKDKDENTNGLIDRHKKTRHFRIGFCFAPLIGESCSFNAMIIYLTIRKTNS